MTYFNPEILKPLIKLSDKKDIDKNIFNTIDKCIKPTEKIETCWSNFLILDPKNKENYEIYHISRMLRCSLLGFKVKLKDLKRTKNNPTILENSVELLSSVNRLWYNLATITNKKLNDEEYSIFSLKEKFDEFSSLGKDFINIGREEDMKKVPVSIVKEVKSTFQKITSEI